MEVKSVDPSRESSPSPSLGVTGSLGIILSSAVCFQCLSVLVSLCLTPSSIASSQKLNSSWRWKNILVSLAHSTLTGLWAVLAFYYDPKMAEDLIHRHSLFSQTLVALSVGYFVYDTTDMLRFQRSRQSYELILHHAVILVCFGVAIVTERYVGYAVVALIVELNSIFLHIRQLLQMLDFSRDNPTYRLNSLVNLGTYIVFRIATLAWMTRWIVTNRDQLPLVLYTIGSVGLAVITVMNIILFYRLLNSDFLRQRGRDKERPHCSSDQPEENKHED